MTGVWIQGPRKLAQQADERKIRDGMHGLLVWATGALLITFIATSSLFGAARTAASGVASATSGAASLVTQNVDPLAMSLDLIMRANGQQPPTAEEREEASRIFVSALAKGSIEQRDRDYLASRLADAATFVRDARAAA